MVEEPIDRGTHEEIGNVPLGDHLRAARLSQGRRLTEVAVSAGVSKAYLSQLERGKSTNPSIIILSSLAESLGLPAEEIGAMQVSPNTQRPSRSVDAEFRHSRGTTIEFKHIRDGRIVTQSTFRLNPGDRITIDIKMPKNTRHNATQQTAIPR